VQTCIGELQPGEWIYAGNNNELIVSPNLNSALNKDLGFLSKGLRRSYSPEAEIYDLRRSFK
jgi:hypothetical protein